MNTTTITRRGALAAALLAATPWSQAQAWPSKPIRMVVPFPAAARPTCWPARSRRDLAPHSASRW